MKHLLVTLACLIICHFSFSQQHLIVDGVELCRPINEVSKDFTDKGFSLIGKKDNLHILFGSIFGFDNTILSLVNTKGNCYNLLVVLPEENSADSLFLLYNNTKEKMRNLLGIELESREFFEDNSISETSPLPLKISAIENGRGQFLSACNLPDGHDVIIGLSQMAEMGARVFISLADKTLDEINTTDTNIESKGVETRLMGLKIHRPVDELARELKKKGFKDKCTAQERAIYRENNITRLNGEFFGVPDCAISIFGSEIVESINIQFPSKETWGALYSQYCELKNAIVNKYGGNPIAEERIASYTKDFENIENYIAFHAIETGNYVFETFLVNNTDVHAFKILIGYFSYTDEHYVTIIYYTPTGLSKIISKSDDL